MHLARSLHPAASTTDDMPQAMHLVLLCVFFLSLLPHIVVEGIVCRVQAVPGKGLGVIAVRDISIGELVMSEAPLLSLPVDGAKPTAEDRRRVLGHVEDEVKRLPLQGQSRFRALSGHVPPAFNDDGGDGDDADADRAPSALDVFRTNALPMGQGRVGIFPDIARLNSHCRPNLHYSWDDASSMATVYAVAPVQAGQELCISYMGPCYPRRDRRGYFASNFGFTCRCTVCALTGDEAMESDHRRATLAGLEAAAQQAIASRDADTALLVAAERLRLFENEGLGSPANRYFCELDAFYALAGVPKLADPEAVREAVARGARDEAAQGRYVDAGDWATRAHRSATLCKGGRSSATLRCLAYASAVEAGLRAHGV
jgi:hypothetical protein